MTEGGRGETAPPPRTGCHRRREVTRSWGLCGMLPECQRHFRLTWEPIEMPRAGIRKDHRDVLAAIDELMVQLPDKGGLQACMHTPMSTLRMGKHAGRSTSLATASRCSPWGSPEARRPSSRSPTSPMFNAMEAALKAPPPVSTEIAQLVATVARVQGTPHQIARECR